MAETIDLTTGSNEGFPALKDCSAKITKTVDCALTNLGAGDTVKVIAVPAGCKVLGVGVEVITPEGAAATLKIGELTDDDEYIASVNANAAGKTLAAGTEDSAAGKLIAADGFIVVKPSAALDKAKFVVSASIIDIIV